eukprot:9410525-Pyramimonas_sp.AAC.2
MIQFSHQFFTGAVYREREAAATVEDAARSAASTAASVPASAAASSAARAAALEAELAAEKEKRAKTEAKVRSPYRLPRRVLPSYIVTAVGETGRGRLSGRKRSIGEGGEVRAGFVRGDYPNGHSG